jgi:hypothetical protein
MRGTFSRRASPMAVSFRFFATLFISVFWITSVQGAVNRTIDDTTGDEVTGVRPVYSPSSGIWEDATCKSCWIQPDRSLAHDGTWTAATYHASLDEMSIEFSFKGAPSSKCVSAKLMIIFGPM